MASHKQKKDKKRCHQEGKRKRKSHGRNSLRKQEGKKKNECKKENIPCNEIVWDISANIDNRKELISQMFSSVGEKFLVEKVPQILKSASREELKKICLEELKSMSNELIIKILEGITVEGRAKDQLKGTGEGSGITNKRLSKHSSRERSSPSRSQRKKNRRGKMDKKRSSSSEEIKNLSEEEEMHTFNAAATQPDVGKVKSTHFTDHHSEWKDGPSTSFQHTSTKKLAKVAPFNITVQQPKEQVVPAPVLLEEEEDDDVISYEVIEFELEEEFEMEDIAEEDDTEVLPEVEINSENGEHPTGMLQPVSEMLELEHRARAIRSMLANIDKL